MAIDPSNIFMDSRLQADACVYCGGANETRDHVPPKVFLDLPHPDELPVVPSCMSCNNSKSLDEEYLACLIECVVCGTADVSRIEREKIRKALGHSKKLHSSIASAMQIVDGGLMWDFDKKRVYDLALKLARGHIAFEEYARLDEPSCVYVNPICTMPDDMVGLFLCDTEYGEVDLWPEIGSRSFLRAVLDVGTGTGYCPSWICVQDFRYRYKMTANGDVLIVIREYLGIYVSWE